MLKAVLVRLQEDDRQTLGAFSLYDDTDLIFSAKSLELPWLDNRQNISCIPTGNYICHMRHSARFGNHLKVTEKHGGEVRGREFILIHAGNFHSEIRGCILLGRDHSDINLDGYRDVTSSKATMRQLNRCIDRAPFSMSVIDAVRTA